MAIKRIVKQMLLELQTLVAFGLMDSIGVL